MHYLEEVISTIKTKKLIFWGAGRRMQSFLKTFCIDKKILPMPDYICDSTRKIEETTIFGVNVLKFDELKKMNSSEVVVIMTAGLFDLPSQIIKNELYYFPIYHCRAFEVYFYLKEYQKKYEQVLSLLADKKSIEIYKNLFSDLINGSFWNQSLYEDSPYFNNNLIPKLEDDGAFVFAGAFNGKHIERVIKNNNKTKVIAFEPNNDWYNYLVNKYKSNLNIVINKNILWNKNEKLYFDGDMLNSGLDAHVCKIVDSKPSACVEGIKIDDIVKEKVQQIALDVEGSECNALLGACNIIKRDKPNLSICLYHNIEDFINIPLLINEISNGKYKFYVKQHSCITAIETVLYAV